MSRVLEDLWRLQQVDSETERLRHQLATLDNGATLRSQVETSREEREALRSELEKARGDLTDGELRLGSLEEKKAAVEKQLYAGQTTNPREVVDLQHDLASLAEVRDRLETKVLQLMDLVGELQARMSEKGRQVEQAEQNLTRVQEDYAAETERLQSLLQERQEERERFIGCLERGLLQRYEQIKQSAGGRAASLVTRGACSECHMAVPAYVLREITEGGATVTCEHCGRLLCVVDGA